MVGRKRRSLAQLQASKRGGASNAAKWDQVKKEKQKKNNYQNMLKTRRELIHSQRRGRKTTSALFFMMLMLFLGIINAQLKEGLSRYDAVDKMAMYFDKNRWKLRSSYDYYIKTGKVLQVLIVWSL